MLDQCERQQIQARLRAVRARIDRAAEASGREPASVRLVTVTKGFAADRVAAAVAAGAHIVGENRVQEARAKFDGAPWAASVERHLIGHLQRNKVGQAVELFQMIHSVDSFRLAEAISSHLERRDAPGIEILLQVNVGGESTKYGVAPEETLALARACAALPRLTLRGLMTIAPAAPDPEQVRPVFCTLRQLADKVRDAGIEIDELSMGMSGDFEVAVAEGATLVRVGSAVFGERARG